VNDKNFTILSETTLATTEFMHMTEVDLELPDGAVTKRQIVHRVPAVIVVPVDDSTSPAELILERQYRSAIDDWILEVPAGRLDESEDPQDAAHRELREETGLEAAKIDYLFTSVISPGWADEKSGFYLATGLTEIPHERETGEEEHMEIMRVPVSELEHLIENGELTDAKSIIAAYVAMKRF
jgi:ADP-ribose pyrophosphatase